MNRHPGTLARIAGLAVLTAVLAACGFHLRGNLPFIGATQNLFVAGIGPGHPFYGDFAQALTLAGGHLAPSAKQAGAIIRVMRANHERRVISLSKLGRGNSFDLTFRVNYQIVSPQGEILLPPQELEIRRNYFNDQSSPLGQGAEEALMRQEMEKEAAQALVWQVVYSLKNTEKPRT